MIVLPHPDGDVAIAREGARASVTARVRPGLFAPVTRFSTAYPDALLAAVLAYKGPAYLGDEVLRDESPAYVRRSLESGILPFVRAADVAGGRILDFGCGSGASTCILARMFPAARIVGVELDAGAVDVARARLAHYELGDRVSVEQSPSPTALPRDLGVFDYISFSAVYEHLLPEERAPVLAQIWSRLKPGGILFINQLPNRDCFFEYHTTLGFPLINYLPDGMTHAIVARLSRRKRGKSWTELLRAGIRGGTPREIVAHLDAAGEGSARLLEPRYGPENEIELWYQSTPPPKSRARRVIKDTLRRAAYAAGPLRRFVIPEVIVAIRKEPAGAA